MRCLVLCAAASLVLALAARAQEPEAEWLERHPLGEPVDPGEVEFLDDAAQAGPPPPAPGKCYAEIDGVVVELDPESYDLLQLIRRSAGVAEVAEPALEADADDGAARAHGILPRHLPPPGSCRVMAPGPAGGPPAPAQPVRRRGAPRGVPRSRLNGP